MKETNNRSLVTKIKSFIKSTAIILFVYDIFAVNLSYFLALWLRFDGQFSEIPKKYLDAWLYHAPFYTVLAIVMVFVFGLYSSIWKYASYHELIRTIEFTLVTTIVHIIVITLVFERMPISYYIVGASIQFLLFVVSRFSYRLIFLVHRSRTFSEKDENVARVMLIGAGEAGKQILRSIIGSKTLKEQVVCIIDDNKDIWDKMVDGVKVVGGRYDIEKAANEYGVDKIYFAINNADEKNKKDIISICSKTGCEVKKIPDMFNFMTNSLSAGDLQNIDVEDLLGREVIKVDLGEIFDYLSGKTILVTGGGGSIGSELCRQIAKHQPKTLVIFDIYENNAYSIQLELKDKYPNLDLHVIIGSVRDSKKLDSVFEEYKPEVVYHAAAHKHVPLMEDSPCEAIKNNVIGTYKTAYAAMVHGCKRFVLISTDKAVNPTNIMGASKRLCEMVVQTFDKMIKEGRADEIPGLHMRMTENEAEMNKLSTMHVSPKTEFVAVRFGNVLGSNGSVIPVFREQIKKGGPVTVTHPDIIRYFMTIPEAVSLVLQASVYANGGEIFVLDMGEPVKIDDLARNMIRLSGFRPDADIKVVYTGLRPGEKLYEEKLMDEEGTQTTPNSLIFIGKPIAFNTEEFIEQLPVLMESSYNEREDIREIVQNMVSTYKDASVYNKLMEEKVKGQGA